MGPRVPRGLVTDSFCRGGEGSFSLDPSCLLSRSGPQDPGRTESPRW